MLIRTTLASSLIVLMASVAAAQYPYADPYAARVDARAVRQAQVASERARASVPVNYTFPVRRDPFGVYGVGIQPSQYGLASSPYPRDTRLAYRPAANYGQNYQQACSQGNNSTAAYASYYPRTTAAAAAVRSTSPYYVGTSLGGPPKVYPKDQPIRNFFRYLIP